MPESTHSACIPLGSLNWVPASARVRVGMSPLPGGRKHCVIPYGACIPVAVRLVAKCYTPFTLPLPYTSLPTAPPLVQLFLPGSQSWPTDRQTDRHKDHTTPSVATGRIYAIHVICLTTDALQTGQPAQAVNPDFARAKFYRMHAWHRSIMDISQILRCTTTAMTNLWLLSLPSSVHTVKLVFDVWSSGLFCGCPEAWNSLPDYLRDPSHSFDSFCRDLKTFLYSFS